MIQIVRNKISAPGILLSIAVAIAFLIGAVISHKAQADEHPQAVDVIAVDLDQ
ncbi:MAG: hypothetical protein ACQKBW_03605 [Puniceicoccales bacterium]